MLLSGRVPTSSTSSYNGPRIQAADPAKLKCLFIGPMKGEDTPTRERFDAVYERIVVPAAKSLGMEPQNALADLPGMITTGIFRLLWRAQVVADVTKRIRPSI
jgi:hypothetical protein